MEDPTFARDAYAEQVRREDLARILQQRTTEQSSGNRATRRAAKRAGRRKGNSA